jgi:ribosomal-protein-alanine N-acetyltransferase
MKGVFIDGGPIYLRPPEERDLEGNWYSWLNDPEVTRYQNKGIFPNTPEKQKAYFQSMMVSRNDVILAIVERESDEHIGSAGLHAIDWVHRSAELGIVIGEKRFWGRGYGKIAWNMITWYGFEVLNLHRIQAIIMKGNISSLKAAEASGYIREGEMRDRFFKNGRYHAAILLAVLSGEYNRTF